MINSGVMASVAFTCGRALTELLGERPKVAFEEGNKAPAFALYDDNGNKVRLADLAGQWVMLYFYPKGKGACSSSTTSP